MTDTSGPIHARIPLRLRLKAWWEGYDLVLRRKASGAEEDRHKVHYEPPKSRWETTRIALVQDVWGAGFIGPGGEEAILHLVNPFGLNPAMSLLELGAGLGGPARIMAEHFGVWVTGMESDSLLAEAGMELSTMAGMAKKAPIQLFDPDHFELQPKTFDCVFSKDFLFTVKDKKRLLRMVDIALKDRGQLLFTDFVLSGADRQTPALEKWIADEPHEPHLWTAEDYAKALTALKFDVRTTEDITAEVQKQITACWSTYMMGVDEAELDGEAGAVLVEEVEFWTRRVKLMEAGDLRVCRILGVK